VDGREALIRFFAGGGRPPRSHEVLLVGPEAVWYLTGMPWPNQRPFDEIGAYRAEIADVPAGRLEELARAAAAEPGGSGGDPDLGRETVRVGDREARWSPEGRSPAAEEFVTAARGVIAQLRTRPWAAVRAGLSGRNLELVNLGEHALEVGQAEAHVGFGRPGRPPSPLRLVVEPGETLDLPTRLEPRAVASHALPQAGSPPDDYPGHDAVYALVHLPFRSPLEDEGKDGWLDGWLISGPSG
jgi:hypothetical protein